ncbi:SSU ribosomal protein S4P [Anaerovirgula multivorans]|uniref:Small ribosomal subunit protein uS4 n=1 Tax=Anaerovirgula multivorans TaxID=312168 RepID=A0A239IMJ8_9FIRM|nr:30S ribosomal protein S4 [Anaerovirgula multivorans]SNS93644.1 SSU ribosomal protein S4P [Anaerovirgula multivorans]
MATKNGPRFKESRRLGLNVCGHPKAMNRAKSGTSRGDRKLSTYGIQLLEKQRLKAYYGVLEKQMRGYVEQAKRTPGITGEVLVKILECRLDNMVYRMGFAKTIRQARQMVVHGHIMINGEKVDRPSYSVKIGDEINLVEKSKNLQLFIENFEVNSLNTLPYIQKDFNQKGATLMKSPEREEIPIEIQDQLVIEYYSTK